jgi:signal transduction histidine kinase
VLAHDLRNPFTTLIGFSELLSRNVRKYEIKKIEEQVSLINSIALQTYNLLDDLLLWSKTQSNKIVFNPKPIDPMGLINSVVNSQGHCH